MKNIMKIVISTMSLFIVIMLINNVQAAGINGTTIVLNAGHGGTETGAMNKAKGLVEKNINLKISQYLEEELNKYYNVKIIQTHDGVNFPNNNCSDLAARAMIARKNNAELYVSLHINDSPDHINRSGSAVFITSRKELPKYNAGMKILGNKILENLKKLGIKIDEGVRTRLCSNTNQKQYKYYDGSYADYYGDIRYAMRGNSLTGYGKDFRDGSGVPTVLIEHCFINNKHDIQFLDSDKDLKSLAKADADAIAEYLELKLPSEVIPSISISAENINLLKGKTRKITANIQPSAILNKKVTWKSNNENIATVDNQGNITAVSVGKTTITVTSDMNSTVSKEIKVNVIELPEGTKIEFPNNKVQGCYISKIGENVTAQDFLSKVDISSNLEVVMQMPNKKQEYIGTGTKVIIKEKERDLIIDEYDCLLYGDVNGDGKISTMDYAYIKNHIMDVQKITDANMILSADLNNDGRISTLDYAFIKNHIMEVQAIELK